MNLLFLFLDGVGLGAEDPRSNPLAVAHMPHLQALLGGRLVSNERLPSDGARPNLLVSNRRASLLALDACLGVQGIPQSATGQATLLTGGNVPAAIGYHYGPKPNPEVAAFLKNGNLFERLQRLGRRVALLDAYPPRYFEAIQSGRRLFSAIPLAVSSAGIRLRTAEDLRAGRAVAADLTARGWREHLGIADAPQLSPAEAGQRLAELGQSYHLAFFEYWLSDYAGHHQDMQAALALLEEFDGVLGGLLEAWDDQRGLVLLTSDHGNLEDLSTRRHTRNPVPALLIGAPELRRPFEARLSDLSDVAPAILEFLG